MRVSTFSRWMYASPSVSHEQITQGVRVSSLAPSPFRVPSYTKRGNRGPSGERNPSKPSAPLLVIESPMRRSFMSTDDIGIGEDRLTLRGLGSHPH